VKTDRIASAPAESQPRDHTRDRVARAVLESGPLTVAALAERLGLTPAAVRRHLDVLLADGFVEGRQPRVYGPRGRGRPPKVFVVTARGRDEFEHAYDVLAADALRFLAETAGPAAVTDFARSRHADLERRLAPLVAAAAPELRASVVAEVLTSEGYAATARPSPSGGEQLCQHHCPVAHVAEQFPQLCEAETEVLARVLGTHVQRLATIAHGDGICTTHIPGHATDHRPGPAPRPSGERTFA
jgi:predicted ArsR family transcriptional regulator